MKGKKLAKCLILPLFLAFSLIITNIPSLPSAKAATFKVQIVDADEAGVSNRALGIGDDPGEYYSKVTGGTATSVTWTSSKPEIASVSSGTVQALKQGVATITVTAKNSSEIATDTLLISSVKNLPETPNSIISVNSADVYAAATADSDFRVALPLKSKVKIMAECADYYRVTLPEGTGATVKTGFILKTAVKIPAQSVELDKTDLVVAAGDSENLGSSFLESYANDVNYSWSSSNSEIATVSGTSASTSVAGKKEGTADINLHAKSSYGEDVSDKAKVWVWAKISNSDAYLKTATSLLTLPKADSASVKSLSADQKVKITGQYGSFYRITVSGSAGFIAKTSLKIPAKSVDIKQSEILIQTGKASKLESTFLESYANDIKYSWSSSNSKIATASNGSANSTIKAVKEGTADIALHAAGSHGDDVSDSAKVYVWAKLANSEAYVKKATALLGLPRAGSSNVLNLAKEQKVKVTGHSGAFFRISANGKNGFIAKTDLKVPSTAVKINSQNIVVQIGRTVNVSASISPAYANDVSWQWKSSNEKIAAPMFKGAAAKISGTKQGVIEIKTTAKGSNGTKVAAKATVSTWEAIINFAGQTTKKVDLLAAAKKGFKKSATLKKGTRVLVLGKSNEFYYVNFEGKKGFVAQTSIERIDATDWIEKPYYQVALDTNNSKKNSNKLTIYGNFAPKSSSYKPKKWTIKDGKVAKIDSKNEFVNISPQKEGITTIKLEATNSAKQKKTSSATLTVWTDKIDSSGRVKKNKDIKALKAPKVGAPTETTIPKNSNVRVLGDYKKTHFFVEYGGKKGFVLQKDVENEEVTKFNFNTGDFGLYLSQKWKIGLKNTKPSYVTNEDFIWSSDKPSIAKVNEKTGEVTADKKNTGNVIITAIDRQTKKVKRTVKISVGKLFDLSLAKSSPDEVTVNLLPKQNTKIHHYSTACSADGKSWPKTINKGKPKPKNGQITFKISNCNPGESAFYKVYAFDDNEQKKKIIESNVIPVSFSEINIDTKTTGLPSKILNNRSFYGVANPNGESTYNEWQGATLTTREGPQFTFDSLLAPGITDNQSFARIGKDFFIFNLEHKGKNRTEKGFISRYNVDSKKEKNDYNGRIADQTSKSFYLYGAHGQTLSTDGKYLFLYLENIVEKVKKPVHHIIKFDKKTLKPIADYLFTLKLDNKNNCIAKNFTMIDFDTFALVSHKNGKNGTCLIPGKKANEQPGHLFFTGDLRIGIENLKLLPVAFKTHIGGDGNVADEDQGSFQGITYNRFTGDFYLLTNGVFANIKLSKLLNKNSTEADIQYTEIDSYHDKVYSDKQKKMINSKTQEFESLEFLKDGSVFLLCEKHPEMLGTKNVVTLGAARKSKGKFAKIALGKAKPGDKLMANSNWKNSDFKVKKETTQYQWYYKHKNSKGKIESKAIEGATKKELIIPNAISNEMTKGMKIWVKISIETTNNKGKATRKSAYIIVK